MNKPLNTKREIILAVKKILKQRMHVFLRTYPDAKKQQLILNAEASLYSLEQAQGESFKITCKRYADFYIAPLIPSPQSKYHDTIKNLHQRLTTL